MKEPEVCLETFADRLLREQPVWDAKLTRNADGYPMLVVGGGEYIFYGDYSRVNPKKQVAEPPAKPPTQGVVINGFDAFISGLR